MRITTRATQSAYVKRGVARQHGDWICTLFRDRIPHRQIPQVRLCPLGYTDA